MSLVFLHVEPIAESGSEAGFGFAQEIVFAVGLARDDGPVMLRYASHPDETAELELLSELGRYLTRAAVRDPIRIVTWHPAPLAFLARRALRHALFPLVRQLDVRQALPMVSVWGGFDALFMAHDLAEAGAYQGIPVAEILRGSELRDAIASGELERVKQHVRASARVTRELYEWAGAAGWVEPVKGEPRAFVPRPPRETTRQALYRRCAELQVQLDKGSVRAACEAAGIAWAGDAADGSDGPQIGPLTTVAQLERYARALFERLPAPPSRAA